mgnify:CR=1 FL=1
MQTAEIICSGSELLLNAKTDTNSLFLTDKLQEIGVVTRFKTTVGDDYKDLYDVISVASSRVDIVIISGGLGPTVDDITRDVLSDVTKAPLQYHQDIWEAISQRLKHIYPHRDIPELVKSQAMVPEGGEFFINQNGTAPGLAIEYNNVKFIALPGPPRELIPMWENQVAPWLSSKLTIKESIDTRIIRTYGIPESTLNEAIYDLFSTSKNPLIGVCAAPAMVDIRLTAFGDNLTEAQQVNDAMVKILQDRLGNAIYGFSNETLEGNVGKLLSKNRMTLSIAESCSGGLIANRITNISGASGYFDRGFVTYSNESKIQELNVPEDTIQEYGAVSKETAEKMLAGLKHIAQSDICLVTTGIAGPGGGTAEKPVGLVYIGLAGLNNHIEIHECHFKGNRDLIKLRTANEALNIIRLYLLNTYRSNNLK